MKYNNKPVIIDNIRFASHREGSRYIELKILFRAGKIQNLQLQPSLKFVLEGEKIFTYRPDFIYFEDGKRVVEDVKGVRTPLYKLKKKLIEAQMKLQIRET
jgi:hypothetical protein